MNIVKFSVLILASLFGGCASVTEPVRVGHNLYLVNAQASGSFYSWGETKNMAIDKANEFCDKQDKTMVVDSEEFSGVRTIVPIEAHIKFRCQSK